MFAILATLAEEDSHGYAVMRQVNESIGGRALLGPGTLYRTLKELRDGDLIEPAETPSDPDIDQRRRYYRLSEHGREVVRAEATRLSELVEAARKGGLSIETARATG